MSIKNLSLQTIALHIGYKDYSKLNDISAIYNKAGYLTNPGISIFGDAIAGQKATVTIYPPNSESKQSYLPSLYVKGDSAFIGDIAVNGSQTITKNLTISGTMRAGFATWSSSIVATSKLFDIEHPSKGKGHRLAHASLEGPEIGVYYRGVLEDSQIINLPNYWKDLVDSKTITVHLTPIGNYQYLHYTLAENKIIVRNFGNASIHCSYIVYGERKDVDKLKVEYKGDTILEQGKPK
jgi:hypothetical protein